MPNWPNRYDIILATNVCYDILELILNRTKAHFLKILALETNELNLSFDDESLY